MNTGIYAYLAQQGIHPFNPFDKSIPGGVALGGAQPGGFGQPLPGIGAGQGGAAQPLPSFQTFAPTPNGGLMAPQQPQAPDPGGGILGALDRVFGGPDMQNLSPKARRQVRRQGLLAMAAQMLTATDPHGNRAQGLAPVGQAIMAGQQAYGQGIQGAQQEQLQQQRQAMYSQLAPVPGETVGDRYNRYLGMFNAAFQSGDENGMKFISQALNTMPKPGGEAGDTLSLQAPKMMLVNGKQQLAAFDNKRNRWIATDGSVLSGDIKEVPPRVDTSKPLSEQMGIYGKTLDTANDIRKRYQEDTKDAAPVAGIVDRALAEVPKAIEGNASSKALLIDAYIRYLNNNKAIREFQAELFNRMQTLQQNIAGKKIKWTEGGSDQLPPELVQQMAATLQGGSAEMHKVMEEAQSRAMAQFNEWNAKFPDQALDPSKYLPNLTWKPSQGGGASGGLSSDRKAAMDRAAGLIQ